MVVQGHHFSTMKNLYIQMNEWKVFLGFRSKYEPNINAFVVFMISMSVG